MAYTKVRGPDHALPERGPRGLQGNKPPHEISDYMIRWQNPDGTWGDWLDIGSAADEAAASASLADADRIAAEAARDIAAGYASDAVSQGNVPIYATVTGMPALDVPDGIERIWVSGYSSATGKGGGPYRKVASAPSHGAKFTTNSGTKHWEYAGDRLTPYHLGAVGAGAISGDGNAIQLADIAAVALHIPLIITWGTYRCGSPVTFNSEVFFEGGILKPDNTINLTFNNSLYALPFRIFDVSLGGTVLGSPKLPNNSIWSEWWGANPVGDCTVGILAAIAFLKQRVISGSVGGVLQFEQGDYGLSSTVVVDFRACKIIGRGDWLTRVYGTGGILLFDIIGHINGSKASYGFSFTECSVAGDNTNQKPTAGKLFRLFEVQQFTIEQNTFFNIYQGIEFVSCEGPLEKQMSRNTWIAPNSKPAISGSYLWYIEGVSTATPGVTTGICHNIHMLSNRGGGIGIQNGGVMDGFDQIKSVGNHIWGCDVTCLSVTSNGQDGYNFFSGQDTYEAINGGAAYAVTVVSNQANPLNAVTFSAGQMLNGSTAMYYVAGTAPRQIKLMGYDMRQAIGDCMLLENGRDLLVSDTSCADIDVVANSGGRFYCIVGNGGVGPDGAIIDNLTTQAVDLPNLAAAAIDLRNGTMLKVSGGRLKGASTRIQMAAAIGARVQISEDVDTDLGTPNVASATTIAPPIGVRQHHLTGTTTVGNINATVSHRNRRLALRIDNGLTLQHAGGGNLRLNGGVNWAAPAGSWIFLESAIDAAEWIETGRQAA